MADTKKSSLQSRLNAILPDLPGFRGDWELKDYNDNLTLFLRKLLDYLRKKDAQLTGPNIFNEIIEQVPDFSPLFPFLPSSNGIGPLTLKCYADCVWVDAASAFDASHLIGTLHASTTRLPQLKADFGVGGDTTGPPNVTKFRAVRLAGKLVPGFTGDYDFQIEHDDGARVYIDGDLVLDFWGGSGTDATIDPIALTAGVAVSFVVEVINSAGGDFKLILNWKNTDETGGNFIEPYFLNLRAP